MLAGCAILAGAALAVISIGYLELHEIGFRENVTVSVLFGFFVGGFGQVMRSAAHGKSSTTWKRVDGWGKLLGVTGWSLASVGTSLSTAEMSVIPSWLMLTIMSTPLVVGGGLLVWQIFCLCFPRR